MSIPLNESQASRHRIAVMPGVPPDPNLPAGVLILPQWLDPPQINWICHKLPVKLRKASVGGCLTG